MHPNYKFYYTFIMLKPDALKQEIVFDIMSYFEKHDIKISKINCKLVTKELILEHYNEVINKMGDEFYEKLRDYMEGKFVIPIVLTSTRPDIIELVRKIVGATNPAEADKGTIRGDLGTDSYQKCAREGRSCENLIHASDSPKAVEREISIWFGSEVKDKLLKDDWFKKEKKKQ